MGTDGHAVTGVMDAVEQRTSGERVSVAQMLDVFAGRTYGPLLLLAGLVLVSPVGAAPGLPGIVATFVILIGAQMVAGRAHLWLPRWIADRTLPRERLIGAFEAIRPWAERIQVLFRPRLLRLADATRPLGLVAIVLALSMFPLGFVPFGVLLPAVALCVLALGLLARDGLVLAVALAITAASLALVGWSLLR